MWGGGGGSGGGGRVCLIRISNSGATVRFDLKSSTNGLLAVRPNRMPE